MVGKKIGVEQSITITQSQLIALVKAEGIDVPKGAEIIAHRRKGETSITITWVRSVGRVAPVGDDGN
jgi:hypothetical protein